MIAIEAHPRISGYLAENLALNNRSNVAFINCAVGESEGEIFFTDSRSDVLNRVSEKPVGISVPLSTLDSLITEATIDLLKIDVEGYELAVLKGASRTLSKSQCVYLESYYEHQQHYGYATRELLEILRESGFSMLFLDHKMSTAKMLPWDHASMTCENIVAVRNLGEFKERTHYQVTDLL